MMLESYKQSNGHNEFKKWLITPPEKGNGTPMKIDDMIKEKRKNPEFNSAYEAEGKKLATAVALYHERNTSDLTQAESAERTDNDTSDHCKD